MGFHVVLMESHIIEDIRDKMGSAKFILLYLTCPTVEKESQERVFSTVTPAGLYKFTLIFVFRTMDLVLRGLQNFSVTM